MPFPKPSIPLCWKRRTKRSIPRQLCRNPTIIRRLRRSKSHPKKALWIRQQHRLRKGVAIPSRKRKRPIRIYRTITRKRGGIRPVGGPARDEWGGRVPSVIWRSKSPLIHKSSSSNVNIKEREEVNQSCRHVLFRISTNYYS